MAKSVKKVSGRSPARCEDEKDMTLSLEYFEKRFSELASKEDVNALKKIIQNQKDAIDNLEAKVSLLESQVSFLLHEADESEQYSRRMCLRIEGIKVPKNEGAETEADVFKAVKEVINQAGLSIPEDAIDRAHRIGKGRVVAGERRRQVIVRFTSFKYRTMLYKARKEARRFRIYLDLTRNRKKILDDMSRYFSAKEMRNCYAFADINCRLQVKLENGFHHVSSYDDFLRLVGGDNGQQAD